MTKDLWKSAPQFDVHRSADYPEVKNVTDCIFHEIKTLRQSKGIRIREADKVKKHLRVALINLWVASKLSSNPYLGISKNKSKYQKNSRYDKIHLTYDYLIRVINDLRDLEYLTEKPGFKYPVSGIGYSTRIRATEKLIEKILTPEYGVDELVKTRGSIAIVQENENRETIRLKDTNKNLVEYEDDENTFSMRTRLDLINNKLLSARITLDITDEQAEALYQRLNNNQDEERSPVDFTNVKLYRVFNNGSWQQGGRFYGGWWQNLPKEYRKYIDINHKPTVELDYSGHHIRILYANEGLDPPDEPYDLTEFDREDQKQAILTMLNADNKQEALKAMANKGIKNAQGLANALAVRYAPIQAHFYTGAGRGLMYQDSIIAEKVMLIMIERSGAVVLPVHDSFIVRNTYANELEEIMVKVFEEQYGKSAKLKFKKTMLEGKQEQQEEQGITQGLVIDNLDELFLSTNSNWCRNIWGL